MSRKRAAPASDDDAPAQPNPHARERVARRTVRLGYLGLLDDGILRDIVTRLEPDHVDPFSSMRTTLGVDETTTRMRIDRWPAFDWSHHLINVVHAGNARLARSLLRDPRVDHMARDYEAAEVAASKCDEIAALFMADPRINVGATRMFQCAARHGQSRIVQALLRCPSFDPSAECNQCIVDVLGTIPIAILQLVLADVRVDPAASINRLIRAAAGFGRADIVQLLMRDSRVDPSAQNNEPLFAAIRNGHDAAGVQLLSDARVDPTARGNSAIQKAATRGCFRIVHHLLADLRVNPSINQNLPLVRAASKGHTAIVRLLLAHPSVHPTAYNHSALTCAVTCGHTDVVMCLCADPRVDPAAHGNWSIRHAASSGFNGSNVAMIKHLLADARVDPCANNNEALLGAIGRGLVENVEVLLASPRIDPTSCVQAIHKAGATVSGPMSDLLLSDPRINPHGHTTYEALLADQ